MTDGLRLTYSAHQTAADGSTKARDDGARAARDTKEDDPRAQALIKHALALSRTDEAAGGATDSTRLLRSSRMRRPVARSCIEDRADITAARRSATAQAAGSP